MNPWDHLPNAKHIDRVISIALHHPDEIRDARLEVWSVDRRASDQWKHEWVAALSKIQTTGRFAAWDAAQKMTFDIQDPDVVKVVTDAIGALIAYDDFAYLLDLPVEGTNSITSDTRSILLLPVFIAFNPGLRFDVLTGLTYNKAGTIWSHLPNAVHIDSVIGLVKADPNIWSKPGTALWGDAWLNATKAADSINREKISIDTMQTIRQAADHVSCDAARGAVLALVAWDNCSYLLTLPLTEVETLANEGLAAAVLLLYVCRKLAKEKELV